MKSFFDQLADSVLDGKPATEDDALAVLRAHDDELLDVVAAAGPAAPRALRQRRSRSTTWSTSSPDSAPRTATTARRRSARPRTSSSTSGSSTDEALEQAAAGPPGRRHPGLHGLQRPRPDQQGRRAGRGHGRHHQGRAPRGRDLRLPRAAQGRPGRTAPRGRRRRLQPQHQHRRVPPRPDRADPHVRRPGRHRREGQDRRAVAVQRAHRRARRDRRAAGRGAVRAQGARLRLDPGQLPDAVRRHALREHLGAHADALREDPGDGAVRLPGQGDPDRRRPRDAPAHACRGSPCRSRTRSSSATTSPRRARPPRPTSS